MELLLEKEKTIKNVKSDNDWLQSIEKFVDGNPKLFDNQSLPNIVGNPESWDNLMSSCIKGNIAGDSSKEASGKQFMIYATNWLDGAKATEGTVPGNKTEVVFPPDAVVSGYIKLNPNVTSGNDKGNTQLDFKKFKQNDLSKEIFQVVEQNEATVFTGEQANLLMNYLKKIINRPNVFKNRGLEASNLNEIHKNYYTSSKESKTRIPILKKFINKQGTNVQADQNSDDLKEVTSTVDIQTLKDTSNFSVGKVTPNNIKDLYVATYLTDDFTVVSDTTGEDVKARAVNYFGGDDIRSLIYDKVANKSGWTNDPILLSYAVLKNFYWGFYENLDPKRMVNTVNTLANLELSGEKLLANIKNTSETKYFLAGCGGFNAEPLATKTGDSKQKIALFNDFSFQAYNWDELINKQDKDLKANLELNLFLTTDEGKKILDDLARSFKQINVGLQASVTEKIVEDALNKLPKITYNNLKQGVNVKPNPLAVIKNYISAFTVKSRTPSDDVKFQLTYTRADAKSATIQPFDHERTTHTDYEIYSIKNVQLTFKKGTKFEIKGSTQTDLAKENLKRWHSTNSTSTKDSYAPFSLEGQQVVFNNNYKCSSIIIRVTDDDKILDTEKGIQFVDLDLLEVSEPEEKEKPEEKDKKPKATIDNDTKPKSGPRRSKIDDKDFTQIKLWAEEFTNELKKPNMSRGEIKALIDKYQGLLKGAYTKDAIAIIPTLLKGAGLLTKYRRFATMVQNSGTQSKNNIQI